MKKLRDLARRPRLLLLAAAPLVAAVGLYVLLHPREAPADAGIQTSRVVRHTLRTQVQATGLVRAVTGAEVKVGARISGQVERLYANVGDKVDRGAPIAKLDDRDLRARVGRARADLAAARAQLALVRRGARGEEIAESDATVRQAVAEADLAELQQRRADALVQKGYAGQEELDRARRDTAVAQARRAAAESRAALVKTRFLPEDVALAEAKVAQAQAVVDEAEATLSYTTIAAPITGVIAQVATQEGETVSAGLNSPTFVTLIDLDRLEVAAYVDEVDVGRIAVGSPAVFTVDAFPDVEFKGSVTAVYPRAVVQSNVVNYITTVRIENSEGRLKPDMTANVVIELAARANVVAVPDRALKREGGKTVVAVVGPQGRETRPVRVGLRGGGLTEIVSGLAEGERIVTAEVLQGERK